VDLTAIAPALRAAFERLDYTADGLLQMLGADAHAALGRGEPVAVRRACTGELGTLVRLLLVGDVIANHEAAAVLAPLELDDAVAAGLLEATPDGVRSAIDVRPFDIGSGTRWVFADLDESMRIVGTRPDHVLGVGEASLSLLRATPRGPVADAIDIGTGCGVQTVAALDHADRVIATDITPRCLDFTRASVALNGIDPARVQIRQGSWYEPVAAEQTALLVANPPFVVGSGTIEHSYRDSGLDLDGASELMIRGAADRLAPGGTAAMLASWIVTSDDWRGRLASWLPDHGIDAWIVQRDIADPALYVGTWMRDGGLDPRDSEAQQVAARWLDRFAEAGVDGVGFGFVFLRRTGEPSDILAEDLRHGFDDPLGDEASAYFDRVAWLRDHDVRDARLQLADGAALERVATIDPESGWSDVVRRLHRPDGPRWVHEVDDSAAALVAGLRHEGLPAADVAELLAVATGVEGFDDRALDELLAGLVRHGLLLPKTLP
jgi:methylase of polypeptide subunit release factors